MTTRELKDSTSKATTTAYGVTKLGTAADTAAAGNDARLSDTRTPTDGSVTTAKVANGAITAAKVAADVATQAELDAVATALTDHTGDTTAAHAASAIAFTPNGSIAATDVQAAIQEVRDEAGGLANPMTTAGDLIVGGSGGTPARLAKGSDGQVLTVDPTTHLLVWATPTGGGAALTVREVDGTPSDSAVTEIVFPNGTLGIASHVATYTPAGGGGGGDGMVIALDADQTGNYGDPAGVPNANFVDFSDENTFTALANLRYTLFVNGVVTYSSDGQDYEIRALIDGVTAVPIGGGWQANGSYTNALATVNPAILPALAAGSHTIKLQIRQFGSSGTMYANYGGDSLPRRMRIMIVAYQQ